MKQQKEKDETKPHIKVQKTASLTETFSLNGVFLFHQPSQKQHNITIILY